MRRSFMQWACETASPNPRNMKENTINTTIFVFMWNYMINSCFYIPHLISLNSAFTALPPMTGKGRQPTSPLIHTPRRQQLAGIKDMVGIHGVLQRAHDTQRAITMFGFQKFQLAHAHTMFPAA